jgi:predicted dehydrogenase
MNRVQGEKPMRSVKGLTVAVVGLRFGRAFAPIYQAHPDVASVVLCDANENLLKDVADRLGMDRTVAGFDGVLAMPDVDAVHLATPIPAHPAQSLAVLAAGKHCACAVPMATDLADLHAIVAAEKASGKNYMMMETAVYDRACLYVQELHDRGEIGRIQFLRGAHYQDMEGWPGYWKGLPPMYYATHAVGPVLRLAGARAVRVHCLGSGTMREERREPYGNPYPAETALFRLDGCAAAAEITRTLFETARGYSESFAVYGEHLTFEWQQVEGEKPVVFRAGPPPETGRGRPVTHERVDVPDYAHRLPPEIARFTQGGHGGSHPHLVQEFVRSIIEERPAAINAVTAADWTAAGICAHKSAMRDGAAVEIPAFG